MPKAMYLHIPFCEHICHYCDFNKVFLKGQPVDEYIKALDKEMEQLIRRYPTSGLETIFIGGGTPTSLSTAQLTKLFKSIEHHFSHNKAEIEYTVEVNPGSVDGAKLEAMARYGVNRLSIGVQSFQDNELEAIGRTHRKGEVMETIRLARTLGFQNISIDLMFGLPQQTVWTFNDTLEQTLDLPIEHVSAYSLKVEAKTVFYNLQRKGKLSLPPEEEEVKMYELLLARMEKNNIHQYEISNFAKLGYESRHNLTYWNNEEYYGFGAGAHGYLNGERYANIGPLTKYLALVTKGEEPIAEKNRVTLEEQIEEEMFMGLRKTEGVSKEKFAGKFGYELEKLFGQQIMELTEKGLLEEDDHFLKLTRRGLLLGNEVFEQFLDVFPIK